MKKLTIIAHRGGFLPEGPIPQVQNKYTIPENTLKAFKRAFENRWGLETDVRIWDDGSLILIHDPDTNRLSNNPQLKIPSLDDLCKLAQEYKQDGQYPFIAFQIKRNSNPYNGIEIGREIAEKIKQYSLKNSMIFDTTIDEAEILRKEFPWLNLSVSVGEKNYGPTIYKLNQVLTAEFRNAYNCVWADEWKIPGSIYNQETFQKLKSAYSGRIDTISPELHYFDHPFGKDLNKIKKLWQKLINWKIINGICTDYPTDLQLLT